MSEQNNKIISLEEIYFQKDAVQFLDDFFGAMGIEPDTSFFEDVEK